MKVHVRLFAAARQLAGCDSLAVEVPAGGTVADVRRQLVATCPPLAALVGHALFAIASQYAADDAPVPAGAEVALIPPVSGG